MSQEGGHGGRPLLLALGQFHSEEVHEAVERFLGRSRELGEVQAPRVSGVVSRHDVEEPSGHRRV